MKKFYIFVILLALVWAGQLPVQALGQVTEQEAFRLAMQVSDDGQRLTALRKFLADFPASTFNPIIKIQIFKVLLASGADEKEYLPIAQEGVATFPDVPQKAFLLNDVAFTLAEAGHGLEMALKCAQQAASQFSADADPEQRAVFEDTLGWVYCRRGEYQLALKNLQLSLTDAAEPNTYEHLGHVYAKSGQPDQAINAFLMAVTLSGDKERKQRRLDALKAIYIEKYKSEAGLEARLAEQKNDVLKERALVKGRYEGKAPSWELANLKGETVRFNDLRGKVVVLYWWGSWCPTCRQELPHFQKLYETYKDKGVAFIGMNFERPGQPLEARIALVKNFLAQQTYNFPVVLDYNMTAGEQYNVDAFPTIFVIDRSGQIRYRTIGFNSEVPSLLDIQIKAELVRDETKGDQP